MIFRWTAELFLVGDFPDAGKWHGGPLKQSDAFWSDSFLRWYWIGKILEQKVQYMIQGLRWNKLQNISTFIFQVSKSKNGKQLITQKIWGLILKKRKRNTTPVSCCKNWFTLKIRYFLVNKQASYFMGKPIFPTADRRHIMFLLLYLAHIQTKMNCYKNFKTSRANFVLFSNIYIFQKIHFIS